MKLNSAGPHQRDVDRFVRAAENLTSDDAEVGADVHRGGDGSIYVEITLDTAERLFFRTYLFAARAECHTLHDYLVWSGGGAPTGYSDARRLTAKVMASIGMPPGFDGLTANAVADLRAWVRL